MLSMRLVNPLVPLSDSKFVFGQAETRELLTVTSSHVIAAVYIHERQRIKIACGDLNRILKIIIITWEKNY